MVKTYKSVYGMCKEAGYCVDGCGICKFIDPNQSPDYKAVNQAQRYRRQRNAGKLFTPDTDGITIGYKDPLVKIDNGYGYFGTIVVDKPTESCVQCHVCGFYFATLGQHIKEHDINPSEYKEKFGLAISKPLLSLRGSMQW